MIRLQQGPAGGSSTLECLPSPLTPCACACAVPEVCKVSKETYCGQKRPTIEAKEIYYRGKRDLL
jgi:hypothetical protein